jgi:hypothetical protein
MVTNLLLTSILILYCSQSKTQEIRGHENRQILVIGDIHGDLDALKSILLSANLIDSNEAWIGGNRIVVSVGDLIDRGPNSRKVMDLMMRLEIEARHAGGEVHTLLGNHELLATSKRNELYLHMNDTGSFRDFKMGARQTPLDSYFNAFQGDSVYAKWIRSRPTILKLGRNLFVHGGIDLWLKNHSINEINMLVRRWVEFEQGVGPKPEESTAWVIGGGGPLWSRKQSAKLDSIKEIENPDLFTSEKLHSLLKSLGADRLFIGHTPVKTIEQSLNHPIYGSGVVRTDLNLGANVEPEVFAFEAFTKTDALNGLQFSRNRIGPPLLIHPYTKTAIECRKSL